MNDPSDEELVRQLQRGETGASIHLYGRYHVRIRNYCARLLENWAEAEDAAQDTYLKALQEIDSLVDPPSFRSWLFRIARNECLMTLRSRHAASSLDEVEAVCDDPTPLDEVIGHDLRNLVDQAIASLKPAYREALILRDIDGLTYAEIAYATQAPLSSVKFRIFKAREALADILGPQLDKRRKQ